MKFNLPILTLCFWVAQNSVIGAELCVTYYDQLGADATEFDRNFGALEVPMGTIYDSEDAKTALAYLSRPPETGVDEALGSHELKTDVIHRLSIEGINEEDIFLRRDLLVSSAEVPALEKHPILGSLSRSIIEMAVSGAERARPGFEAVIHTVEIRAMPFGIYDVLVDGSPESSGLHIDPGPNRLKLLFSPVGETSRYLSDGNKAFRALPKGQVPDSNWEMAGTSFPTHTLWVKKSEIKVANKANGLLVTMGNDKTKEFQDVPTVGNGGWHDFPLTEPGLGWFEEPKPRLFYRLTLDMLPNVTE